MDNYSMIKSLAPYDCSYKIVRDYEPKAFNMLSDDVKLALEHADDYEGVSFCVLNDDTVFVLDCLTGDLQGMPVALDEFIRNVIETAKESVEE